MPAPNPPSQSQSPASKKAALAASGDGDDFTRLHITPFDAGLVDIVIPVSIRPRARNVSFHSVATFPENRYGYVDLPRADAERLKAKLNGSVLKGTKMRIETAHPEVREEPSGEQAAKEKNNKKAKAKEEKSSKKRKRGENVDEGVLLTDRKVKRGWTEIPDYKSKKDGKDRKKDKGTKGDKDKKLKRIKSKYTDQDECLLKVRLPSGVTKNLPDDDEAARKKRKKKGKEREVIVHEFENTIRFPSFLKGTAGESSRPEAAEFVEGKGWVDEDGNIVEPVASSSRPSRSSKSGAKKAAVAAEESDDTSSSGTSSSEDEEEEAEKDEPAPKESAPAETSDTSNDDSDDEDEAERSVELSTPVPAAKTKRTRPDSSSSSKNLTIKIPPPNTPSPSKQEVHPLEALYKRKKPEDGVTETPAQAQPFTFFGGDGEDEDEEDGGSGTNRNSNPPMPMTPFTRQDFEWRNVRSAAPTPDTAHPSRVQSLWSMQEDDEEGDEDMDDAPISEEDEEQANEEDDGAVNKEPNGTSDGKQSSSDFQSWFWENRRDLNQSWMKRRKAAAKEKRHRENKARASKAV